MDPFFKINYSDIPFYNSTFHKIETKLKATLLSYFFLLFFANPEPIDIDSRLGP